MLILTRKIGESIKIGDDVTLTVLGMSGRQIRLGIDAPPQVSIHREEIYERIRAEREQGIVKPLPGKMTQKKSDYDFDDRGNRYEQN